MVVEGTVSTSESFWNADQTAILTRSTLEVSKSFKGEVSPDGTVIIITKGGTVDDRFQIVTHSFQVGSGEEGIFFLQIDDQAGLSYAYRAKNISGPFVRYTETKTGFRAQDRYGTYHKPLHDLYEPILTADHTKLTTIRPNSLEANIEFWLNETLEIRNETDPLIHFAFDNIELVDAEHVEFDIVAKTTETGIRFAETEIYLNYTIDAFGENIVANEKIEAWKETIIEGQTYTMALNDENPDVVRLLVDHGFEPDSLYPLSQFFQKFVHVRLDVETIWQLASLSFDDLTVANQTIFYDPETQTYFGFDKIAVSDPVFPFMMPEIESITPTTLCGGTDTDASLGPDNTSNIVTISGSNFGDLDLNLEEDLNRIPEDYRVDFRREEDNSSESDRVSPQRRDYIEWTNTLIRVKVPSGGYVVAGNTVINPGSGPVAQKPAVSGTVRVVTPLGHSTADDLINIVFSVINSKVFSPNALFQNKLFGQNPFGGYYFIFEPSFNDIVPNSQLNTAKQEVIRAFCEWNENTNVPFAVLETCPPDAICLNIGAIVLTTNGEPDLNIGAAAPSNTTMTICTDESVVIDMRLRYNLAIDNWQTGPPLPGNPYNIYKTALHEVGHLHQLHHVREPTSIMNSTFYTSNTSSSELDNNSIDGARHVGNSGENLTCDDFMIQTLILQEISGCSTSHTSDFTLFKSLSLIPNIAIGGDKLKIEGKLKSYTLFDSSGRIVSEVQNVDSTESIDTNGLDKGLYFIHAMFEDEIGVGKFVVQ